MAKVITYAQALRKEKAKIKKDPKYKTTLKFIKSEYPDLDKANARKLKEACDQYRAELMIEAAGGDPESSESDVLDRIKGREIVDGDNPLSELNEVERTFCFEYLRCFNETNASRICGFNKHQTRRLMKDPRIQEAIRYIQKEREVELYVDGMSIIRMYTALAFSDLSDYANWYSEERVLRDDSGRAITNEDGEVVTYRKNVVNLKDSSAVDCRCIQEIKEGKDGVSIKMYDKMEALDKLSKIFDIENNGESKQLDIAIKRAKLKQEEAKARLLEDSENIDLVLNYKSAEFRTGVEEND